METPLEQIDWYLTLGALGDAEKARQVREEYRHYELAEAASQLRRAGHSEAALYLDSLAGEDPAAR